MILSGEFAETVEASMIQSKEIMNQQIFPAPTFTSIYRVARFFIDLYSLEKKVSNESKVDPLLKKRALQSGKMCLKILRRHLPYSTRVYRLMGKYHWIIGNQKQSFKWWDKSIKTGEIMGARPDLSRTYFEVGRRLVEPDSKAQTLNGITAEEYLDKARTMFKEMDLQWDLDELDKVIASN